MKFVAVTVTMVLLGPATICAQEPSATDGPTLRAGVEADVLPYVTGGWYASGWVGYDRFRLRLVASWVNPPDFTLKDEFTDAETRAYAALLDYFPRPAFGGPWIGGGIEHWDNRVGHPDESATGTYHNWMATVGAGWVFGFGRHLYLNPLGGGSLANRRRYANVRGKPTIRTAQSACRSVRQDRLGFLTVRAEKADARGSRLAMFGLALLGVFNRVRP